MTTDNIPPGLLPEAVDLRRAAVLAIHANPERLNLDGIGAVVSEVKGDLRITQLVAALGVLAYAVSGGVPLGSDAGQSGLAALVSRYAAMEHEGSTHNE